MSVKSIKIHLPHVPTAKGRPRMTKNGHVYTPGTTRDATIYAKNCFAFSYKEKPLQGPVYVDFLFVFPELKKPKEHKTSKPDLDNLIKLYADAANGILWMDDAQITMLSAEKKFGKTPEVIITVNWRGE